VKVRRDQLGKVGGGRRETTVEETEHQSHTNKRLKGSTWNRVDYKR
jgi:hypothetical protein